MAFLASAIFFIIIFVGFIIVFVVISRRMSGQVFDATKASYLKLSGVDGVGKIISITDTGKNVANTYFIFDVEVEILSLVPSVKTKAQGTFLKNQIPTIGSTVKVRYDPKDPKLATVTA